MLKTYLSMALVAITSVLVFSGCVENDPERREEEAEIMDIQAGSEESSEEKLQAGSDESPEEKLQVVSDAAEGRELMASAGSEKEAMEIAERYGIELVEYSNKIAVFHTDEDPGKVIEKGKTEGWPLLSINGKVQAFEGTQQMDIEPKLKDTEQTDMEFELNDTEQVR